MLDTIPMDRAMAYMIMGALATTFSEGTIDAPYDKLDSIDSDTANRLVRVLYNLYPDIVSHYDWLPEVKALNIN